MNTPTTAKLRKCSLPKPTTISAQDNHSVISSNFCDNEDSPTYLSNTQESIDGIDVGWDWNSPQSSQRKYKKVKKCLIQSPQMTMQRCSLTTQQQYNQNTQLERLHDELKALQRQLAQPDDEDCLCVSPQQEREFKTIVLDNDNDRIFTEFDDIFNDSVDEQLLLCSQKVETTVISDNNHHQQQQQQQKISDLCNNSIEMETDNDIYGNWDVDFSIVENQIKDTVQMKTLQQRTKSEEKFKQTTFNKVEFQRTKSFEIETTSQQMTTTQLSKAVLDEIERKRREAKLKLEAKRSQQQETNKRISPSQCTDEEIEKKRQEAKAKLEAKRLQDIVERNRQEAIKRLQMKRQKNAIQLKRL